LYGRPCGHSFQLDIVGSGSVAQKASGGESLAANLAPLIVASPESVNGPLAYTVWALFALTSGKPELRARRLS
jgi:hypothetical protein